MTQGFTQPFPIPVPVSQGGTGLITNNTGGALIATAPGTLVSSTVPYPAAAGWTSYTSTLTLVGGAGNTVPTFSTFDARYSQVGNVVHVQVNFLNAAGGTAGAGTGILTMALPIAAGASISTTPIGAMGLIATTVVYPCVAVFTASASTCTFTYINTVTTASVPVTGAVFASGARYLQMQFFYEI